MTVKMDLKKIMALAVLAIVALPSLTTVIASETFTIDGYKYKDKNRNGAHDEGEPGVEGVTITLTRTDADVADSPWIETTDKEGYFSFKDVQPGTYMVTETVPEGWVAYTDTSHKFTASSGETVNLGFVFGNYVLETETDLKCAIEIASLYLEDIKGIVDALSKEYGEDPDHGLVLKQVKDILGYDDAEGAEDFLRTALEAYEAGDYNRAARSLAAARNILGRVNGMLTSVFKAHKVARTERFMKQVEHRIEGLEDKIERLRTRRGTVKTKNANAAMNQAKLKLSQLGASLSVDNVDDVIDAITVTIADVNAARDEMGDEMDGDNSDILEAIDRLETKIRVLKASSDKLAKKGSDTLDIDEELERADSLLDKAFESLMEGHTDEAEDLLEQADDIVVEASNNLRTIRHPNKIKVNIHSRPEKKIK